MSKKDYNLKLYSEIALLGIILLFFFQMITDLVESIYMMDLMNLTLDAKVLGMLFLLTAVVIVFYRKGVTKRLLQITGLIIIAMRILDPLLIDINKMIVTGIGVGAFFIFFPATILSHKYDEDGEKHGLNYGLALVLALMMSILFRTFNSTLDVSMFGIYQSIGWVLAVVAVLAILTYPRIRDSSDVQEETITSKKKPSDTEEVHPTKSGRIFGLVFGVVSVFILIYFAFESPTVFSRWTDTNYIVILGILSIVYTIYAFLAIYKPDITLYLKNWVVWLWNVLFVVFLVLTVVTNIVIFDKTPTSPPVIAPQTTWAFYIPLVAMLVLSPILLIDFSFLTRELIKSKPKSGQIGGWFTLAGLYFMLLIFILIFTNVWGYVGMVSRIFRNMFFLPFLIASGVMALSILIVKKDTLQFHVSSKRIGSKISLTIIFAILLVGTFMGAFITSPKLPTSNGAGVTSITVMQYNCQQGVNVYAEKNYQNQLNLIKSVNPDIIGIEESDTAKVSGGNSDLVRYLADNLNYYSVYGPKTVTGTYGVALLSKYPIFNATEFFTYSDQDEVATLEAQILIGTHLYTIFVNHPDGSADAKFAQIDAVMQRVNASVSAGSSVISLGDFNSNPYSQPYNYSVNALQDTSIGASQATSLGNIYTDRIDYIFASHDLSFSNSTFIPSPASQTDHPAYYTTISV